MRKLSLREGSESGNAGRSGRAGIQSPPLVSSGLRGPWALGDASADSLAELGSPGLFAESWGWLCCYIHTPLELEWARCLAGLRDVAGVGEQLGWGLSTVTDPCVQGP